MPLSTAAFESLRETGRNGRGNVVVFAAGNGGQINDNANHDPYCNHPLTIAVAAVETTINILTIRKRCLYIGGAPSGVRSILMVSLLQML